METISRAEAKRVGLRYYFTGTPCAYGHVSDRFTRNSTCVECDSIRGHKAAGKPITQQCVICDRPIQYRGHMTCSRGCKQTRDKARKRAKQRAKYELKDRYCHGCGAVHHRRSKWFCSDECRALHVRAQYEAVPFKQVPCSVCGIIFYAKGSVSVCSSECRKKRDAQQQHAAQRRQVESGYIAEYNRKLRAKVAAAVTVARELDIVPKPAPTKHPQRPKPQPTTSDERWLFDYMQMCKRPTHAGACIVCEAPFPPWRSVTLDGRPRARFCSYRCGVTFSVLKRRYDAGPKDCPHCGALWWPTKEHPAYCSTACSDGEAKERGREHSRDYSRRHKPEVNQRKRRREREQYAIMLAFKQMGLLQQEKQT